VGTSRRLQVRLPSALVVQVEELAGEHGISLSDALRVLVARGAAERAGSSEPLALAATVASEHALLLLAGFLPDGERRLAELGERAIVAARERIALLGDTEARE
jgi:Ribbon-helix-helix protein, copG family